MTLALASVCSPFWLAPQALAAGSAAPKKASPDQTAGDKLYKEAQELYAKGQFEDALSKLQIFVKKNPKSPLRSQAENLLGLSYLLTRRPDEAITHFRNSLEFTAPGHAYGHYVSYNLARALKEAGKTNEADQALSKIDPLALDRENRIKYHHLKVNLLLHKNLPFEAARESLAAGKIQSDNPEVRKSFTSLLTQSLQAIDGVMALEDLYRTNEESSLSELLLVELIKRSKARGDSAKAKGYAEILKTRFPGSPLLAEAVETAQTEIEVEPESPVKPGTIGVLLPLKGKFARIGAHSLQAIELAFGIFGSNQASGPDAGKITLVIKDSGDEPDQAVRALEDLVKRHHVAAVIGPLLSKGIDTITKRAEELRVPLLSLARQEPSSSATNGFAIPAGLTLRMQAYELARYAIEKLNKKRFAILSPRDKVGQEFTDHFWNAVEILGGSVKGYESYNPGETDFRQQVDKLSGLFYTDARRRELAELTKLREENQITKRNRKTEKYFALPPIVDYDAVFVPDEPRIAGQILPTFAYRDVDNVLFLGPSAWNSPELTSRLENGGDRTFFAEAFFPAASPEAQKFVSTYQETFSEAPNSFDAVAYDSAKLLRQALTEAGASAKRGDILSELHSIDGFEGATGKIKYREGRFERTLKFLTIHNRQIVEATLPQQTRASP